MDKRVKTSVIVSALAIAVILFVTLLVLIAAAVFGNSSETRFAGGVLALVSAIVLVAGFGIEGYRLYKKYGEEVSVPLRWETPIVVGFSSIIGLFIAALVLQEGAGEFLFLSSLAIGLVISVYGFGKILFSMA